ncbi:DUF488 domain-containing protein [Nostoc sp. NMS4]|uniref:DUF488 domain-containing protein n=1 Tax=Nostoc sp. NMS4 TaxID=2815390 RepID=UPI0025E32208|nr:DUF488 domain-containing protein [Nostoc sp. NMS4]MBN3924510.1 DUF488 domain-containing protein [Nostoc sp. NMS4]
MVATYDNQNAIASKYILTFGYGNRKNYDEFFSYLEEFNVVCVVDVRLHPRAWSRKWYGEIIKKSCSEKNIKYVSKASLGNTSGNSNWIPPNDEEAAIALQEISEIAQTGTILLLCAEKKSYCCHRAEVALHLQKLVNNEIKHLG